MPDPWKENVLHAVLSRFPEVGQSRDIALSGPSVVAEVVSRSNNSVTLRTKTDYGFRYFEIKVTEKL